jgi:hypothetical protein
LKEHSKGNEDSAASEALGTSVVSIESSVKEPGFYYWDSEVDRLIQGKQSRL